MSQAALRPLTVGEILDQSFGLYRRFLPVLVTITVTCTLLPQLGLAYYGVVVEPTLIFDYLWQYLVLLIALTILSALAIGASTLVLSEGYLGRSLATGEALRRASQKLLSIIGVSIETSLAAVLGFMLLLIPGLVVIAGYAVGTQALMIEPGLKMQSAMARSWSLTKGSRLRVLGVLGVTAIILVVITVGGAAVVGLIAAAAGLTAKGTPEQRSYGFQIVLQATNIVVKTVLMPLLTCVLTVTYFDLRVRAEGFDLEALAAALPGAGMSQIPADSIHLVLRRVFEDPAYRWVRPSATSTWWHHWINRFLEWFNRVSEAHPLVGFGFVVALLAILVVILVHGAFIVAGTLRRVAQADGAGGPVQVAEPHDAAWHRRAAERLLREGRYTEALMEEFWALIADLESRNLVRFQPAKTPGEYLLDAGLGPADRSALGRLVERLYSLVFAGRGCRAEDVAEWRAIAAKEWGGAAH